LKPKAMTQLKPTSSRLQQCPTPFLCLRYPCGCDATSRSRPFPCSSHCPSTSAQASSCEFLASSFPTRSAQAWQVTRPTLWGLHSIGVRCGSAFEAWCGSGVCGMAEAQPRDKGWDGAWEARAAGWQRRGMEKRRWHQVAADIGKWTWQLCDRAKNSE
jgi:hypothetical protein